jgi:hypothetical protein
MSDGTTVVGTPDTIWTEDTGDIRGKIPRSKISIGILDADDGDVSSANPMPITGSITVSNFPTTQVVTGTINTIGTATVVPAATQTIVGTVTTVPGTGTRTVSGTVTTIPSGTQTVVGTFSTTPPALTTVGGTVTTVPSGTQTVNLSGSISNGATPKTWIADGTTIAQVWKASAGTLYSLSVGNTDTAPIFVDVYNSTTDPGTSGTPSLYFMVPGNSTISGEFPPQGYQFTTGITLRIHGLVGSADATPVTVNTAMVSGGIS